MSDNRPFVYREGDTTVYRASAVGRSIRCLATARQGYTPLPSPEYLAKAASAGNLYEGLVKDRLRDLGWRIGDEQREVELVVQAAPRIIVRGHLDAGWVAPPSDTSPVWGGPSWPSAAMLEVKSMSKRMFAKWMGRDWTLWPSYAAQAVCYGEAMQLPIVYAVVCRDTDDLDLGLVTPESLPVTWEDLRRKLLVAEWWGQGQELPPCDTTAEYFCPFDYLCDRRKSLFAEVESGTEEVLVHLAEQYDAARALADEAASGKEAARKELLVALEGRGLNKVQAGPWSITASTYDASSFDRAAAEVWIRAHGGDPSLFVKKTPGHRLTVKGGRST